MDKVPDPPVKSDDKNLCSNLRNNLRSNLRKSLCNNPDLRTVSLISSNSHPFLHKLLTSSRRSSVEKDSKTSAVLKVATEVATSVIQTGTSREGYHEG